jgi:tight adherence protein C
MMPTNLLIALVGVFISVGLLAALTAAVAFSWNAPERRLLRRYTGRGADSKATELQLAEAPSTFAKRLQQVVPKSPHELGRLRRRLATAGYRDATAAVFFGLAEIVCAVLLALVPLIVMRGSRAMVFAALGGMVGYLLPGLWLARKTANRQKQITNGLPDALDLMVVCVEAGSGLDQAIIKTSDELDIAYPALAEEMRLISTEIRAGKARLEAFKNFAARTKVDDVRALVAMLVQTDRFGTSIAQALRTHAETARIKRRQRAEERAAKIGVKLVFPLVFFLFPALYVAILGPAVIQYVRVFKGQVLK